MQIGNRSISGIHLLIGLTALAIGVYVRFHYSYYDPGDYDTRSWEQISLLAGSDNFYLETTRHSYPPMWAYILWGLRALQEHTPWPMHLFTSGFLSVVDILTAGLILFMSNRKTFDIDVKWAALYLVSPVMIFPVAVQGQFEVLALFPLLVAVALTEEKPYSTPLWLMWLLGTLSVITKHITVFAVWALYFSVTGGDFWKAAGMMAGTLAVFVLVFVPYLPEAYHAIMRCVVYRFQVTDQPNYGPVRFLPTVVQKVLFYVALFFAPFTMKRRSPGRTVLLSLISFLIFSYLVGRQYYVLPFALGCALRSPWALPFSICITPYVFWWYQRFSVHEATMRLSGLVTWFVTVAWAASLIWWSRRSYRR